MAADLDKVKKASEALRQRLSSLAAVQSVGLRRRGGGFVVLVRITGNVAAGTIPGQIDAVPVIVERR